MPGPGRVGECLHLEGLMRRLVSLRSLLLAAYAAFVLAAAFIFGIEANLAGRNSAPGVGAPGVKQKGGGFEERFSPSSSYDFWQRTTLPTLQGRVPGLSPLGDRFKTLDVPGNRRGLVLTPRGFRTRPRRLPGTSSVLKRSPRGDSPGTLPCRVGRVVRCQKSYELDGLNRSSKPPPFCFTPGAPTPGAELRPAR